MPLTADELACRAGGGRAALRASGTWAPTPSRMWAALGADVLVQLMLRRGRWSLHRHVHVVAAFEEVSSQMPIRRLLSIGSGAGLSELYLAAAHPELAVTVTDVDPTNLARARRRARQLGLSNVTFRPLDLLDAGAPVTERYDLVIGVEVLEHIDDDRRAATQVAALSRAFVYQLVPYCTDADLADAKVRAREWQRHGHHRPGYTHETLAALFSAGDPAWIRTCYVEPEASSLRHRIEQAASWVRLARRHRLVMAACADVGQHGGVQPASGIEILTRVAPPA
jgi:SAM-dependent methyltransferase